MNWRNSSSLEERRADRGGKYRDGCAVNAEWWTLHGEWLRGERRVVNAAR